MYNKKKCWKRRIKTKAFTLLSREFGVERPNDKISGAIAIGPLEKNAAINGAGFMFTADAWGAPMVPCINRSH